MKIGIDFGTAYSVSAIERAGQVPELIPDCTEREPALFHTPSAVCLSRRHALVGRKAEKALDADPTLVPHRFFKRNLGTEEPIWHDPEGMPWYAETIAALVLKKLRVDAEIFMTDNLIGAVLAVPAHFAHNQRNALLAAASMADIPVLDLIDEPVAAALSYGLSPSPLLDKPVFVYDFGGGTFDATVLKLAPVVQVYAKVGNSDLGGREIDNKVSELILDQFKDAGVSSLNLNSRTLLDLRRAAEEIKIDLCTRGKNFVQRNVLLEGRSVQVIIRRSTFEAAVADLIEQSMAASRQCLEEAGIAPYEVGTVLLVGGSSWVPVVQKRIKELFHYEGQRILFHEPTRAVAIGAALRLRQLQHGVRFGGLPAELNGKTGYCVGIRALDATTGNVVIETLIKRNQSLPAHASKRFFTWRPDQTHMKFEIFEFHGSTQEAASVGELSVGPLPKPRHDYPIDVNIEYRSDGILSVKATDPEAGRELSQEFGKGTQEAARFLRQQALMRAVTVNQI